MSEEKIPDNKIPLKSSASSSQMPAQENSQSKRLSTDIAKQLVGLMKDVTKSEVSPKTVKAACDCAKELHKLLKLNFEMKKFGMDD